MSPGYNDRAGALFVKGMGCIAHLVLVSNGQAGQDGGFIDVGSEGRTKGNELLL